MKKEDIKCENCLNRAHVGDILICYDDDNKSAVNVHPDGSCDRFEPDALKLKSDAHDILSSSREEEKRFHECIKIARETEELPEKDGFCIDCKHCEDIGTLGNDEKHYFRCDKHCIRLDNPDYSEACQHYVERDKVHEEKHFCSECVFCAMMKPDEEDMKSNYWSYKWRCLKTNLTIAGPDACDACNHFVLKDDSKYKDFIEAIEKPPLGIEPYWIHACTRISDICDAIQRTINATSIDLTALRKYTKEIGALSDYLETMREDKE